MSWGPVLLILAGAYAIGSVPFGYIIGKIFYKTDIREHGSKNPGATNVWRTFGRIPGITTLLLDIAKGLVPILLYKRFFSGNTPLLLGAGLSLIAGHNWSLFLKGKGGKGVATSAGVFLAMIPVHTGIALLTFGIVFGLSKRVSLGSMAAAVALLFCTFVVPTTIWVRWTVVIVAVMILVRHVPNMRRLARGEEPPLQFKTKENRNP